MMGEAPGPTYYEPPEVSDRAPCRCEAGVLRDEFVQMVGRWLANEYLRYDWRVDYDLCETADRLFDALEWGPLCRECAADKQREMEEPTYD